MTQTMAGVYGLAAVGFLIAVVAMILHFTYTSNVVTSNVSPGEITTNFLAVYDTANSSGNKLTNSGVSLVTTGASNLLTASNKGNTSGYMQLQGGDGTKLSAGGLVSIIAGSAGSGVGGTAVLNAGAATGIGGTGGDARITGGGSTGVSGGDAGAVIMRGGDSIAAGGGPLVLSGGLGTKVGGSVTMSGGTSTGAGGGPLVLSGGLGATIGGSVTMVGGDSDNADGGSLMLSGGIGATVGGSVTIQGGTGATTRGAVHVLADTITLTTTQPEADAVFTYAGVGGVVRNFVTGSTPESVISSTVGALANDVINGNVYVKNSGVGNIGWSILNTISPVVKRFIADGTYTPSQRMVYCIVEVLGGGGSGSGTVDAVSKVSCGSGGGAGGYSKVLLTSADIGASKSVLVGTGGLSSVGGSQSGDPSSFGGTLSVGNGGVGGVASISVDGVVSVIGGLGGTASFSAPSTEIVTIAGQGGGDMSGFISGTVYNVTG